MMATAPHVLLAEDSLALDENLKLCLEATGLRVTITHGGWSALDLLDCVDIDVVIAGDTLPGLSSSQLCFRTSGDRGHRQVPVIVVKANYGESDLPWLKRQRNLLAILDTGKQLAVNCATSLGSGVAS